MTVKYCRLCKNKGMEPKCIFCGRKARPNPVKRRKELDRNRRKEIKDLWSQATLELWMEDRRKYERIIERIKQLEGR